MDGSDKKNTKSYGWLVIVLLAVIIIGIVGVFIYQQSVDKAQQEQQDQINGITQDLKDTKSQVQDSTKDSTKDSIDDTNDRQESSEESPTTDPTPPMEDTPTNTAP